jgi:hypothetical protein
MGQDVTHDGTVGGRLSRTDLNWWPISHHVPHSELPIAAGRSLAIIVREFILRMPHDHIPPEYVCLR